jgi:hypothetical protein
MNYYLRLKHVPELQGLTAPQRSRVHRACYRQYGALSWKTQVGLLALGVCSGLGLVMGGQVFMRMLGWSFFPSMLLGSVIGIGSGYCIYWPILVNHLRPYYAEYIRTELSDSKP